MESDQILKRVLITDEVDSSCIDILKSNGIEVFADTKLTKQQLLEIIKDYDGLVVRSATKVTEDVILAGTRLKIIGRAGTGVDNVDVKTATQRGIAVMNTPDGNTLSAAELTCAMLLTTSRNIAQGTEAVKSENWKLRSSLMGNELFGKTLAVIGLGRIGREVAVRMQAFGMKTIGYDPIINGEVSITFGVEWLPLPEIWSRADYITIHVPLIPPTKYMINAQTLSQCKRGVRIVNCARGGIIDESALLDALNSGHCAAAGLDVFEQEPTTNKELVNHSRVTSTPHLGASTYEAQVRVANDIAKQFVSYSTGSELIGVINAPALTHFLDSSSRCWMELTTGLTQLSASLVTTSNLDNSVVSITLEGRELTELKSGVEGAASVGLLKCVGDGEKSNLISGPYIIKQRNIKIDTEMKQCSGRQSSVSVEIGLHPGVSTGLKVIGTVLQGHSYLLSVDGSDFIQPVRLTGCMLIIRTSKAEELQLLTDKLRNCAVDVLSFIKSANQSNEALHTVWCCIQLSSPLTSELLTTLKVTNNELIKQVQFN